MGKEKTIGYHAKTEQQADYICKALHSQGKKWRNKTSYLKDNHYRYFKDQTVYTNIGTHVTLEWCKERNIEVQPFYECELVIKKKRAYWRIIVIILFLIALFCLFTSCTSDDDIKCDCEIYHFQKDIDFPKGTIIPIGALDTMHFEKPISVEPFSNDCSNHNLILRKEIERYDVLRFDKYVFYRDIVKCE